MSAFSDDDLTAELLRRGTPIDGASPAPTDAALAAWAEGRLDPERASVVEAYLASHDDARAEAFVLRDGWLEAAGAIGGLGAAGVTEREGAAGANGVSLEPVGARRFRWVPFATAAAALLAIGALTFGAIDRDPSALDSDARLLAAAGPLSQAAPALFRDFRPLDAAERRAAVEDATRSGLSILAPAGRVVDVQPELRWTAWDGDSNYDVVIADADGAELWRHSTTRPWIEAEEGPKLARGRSYLIEVSATGWLGRATATRPFDVADLETSSAVASGRAAARRLLGAELGDLAFAHGAARKGFLADAKRVAAAYVARNPKDVAARELDEYLRRRLGWPAPAAAADGPR